MGQCYDGVTVSDARSLETEVRRLGAEIAIIAVPPEAAQDVADQVAAAGIHAILDFSSAAIAVPPSVTLRSMNMAVELEILSFALTEGARH